MWTAIATGDVGREIADSIYTASKSIRQLYRWLKSAEIQQALVECQSVQGRIFHYCQWFIEFVATVRRFFSQICLMPEKKLVKLKSVTSRGGLTLFALGLGDITAP